MTAEEVDILLQRSEGGVDSALTYAKTISKYMKDLIGYVEKRISLGKTVTVHVFSICDVTVLNICIIDSALYRPKQHFTGFGYLLAWNYLHFITFLSEWSANALYVGIDAAIVACH